MNKIKYYNILCRQKNRTLTYGLTDVKSLGANSIEEIVEKVKCHLLTDERDTLLRGVVVKLPDGEYVGVAKTKQVYKLGKFEIPDMSITAFYQITDYYYLKCESGIRYR